MDDVRRGAEVSEPTFFPGTRLTVFDSRRYVNDRKTPLTVRKHAMTPDAWDICMCDHYRAEHDGGSGECECVVIAGGHERNCVCRAFRFKRRRKA